MTKRHVLLLIGSALVTACSTVRPVDSPSVFVQERRPDWVRVTNKEGSTFVLQRPTFAQGTLQGFETQAREEIRLSPDAIQRMEAKQIDRTRTAVLIGGGALVAAGAVWAITSSGSGPRLICDGYELPRRCQEAAARLLRFR
jgi:hypothetical protein